MTTITGTRPREPVAVPQLQHGDTIHIGTHEVFRHTQFAHTVTRGEADVQVDCLIIVEHLIVICWRGCHGVCGAVVYDADDSVMRLEAAAA